MCRMAPIVGHYHVWLASDTWVEGAVPNAASAGSSSATTTDTMHAQDKVSCQPIACIVCAHVIKQNIFVSNYFTSCLSQLIKCRNNLSDQQLRSVIAGCCHKLTIHNQFIELQAYSSLSPIFSLSSSYIQKHANNANAAATSLQYTTCLQLQAYSSLSPVFSLASSIQKRH